MLNSLYCSRTKEAFEKQVFMDTKLYDIENESADAPVQHARLRAMQQSKYNEE
jgi:orotidine-5'-phosphate decarboxylase